MMVQAYIIYLKGVKRMSKSTLAVRAAAGILYAAGIIFAFYIGTISFTHNVMFDMKELIFCSAGVLIPSAAAVLLLISSERKAEKRFAIVRFFIINVFAFYDMLLIQMLFFRGFHGYSDAFAAGMWKYIGRNANFIPFRTITGYVCGFINNSINNNIIAENLLGNAFLFAPMGILLPIIFKSQRRLGSFLVTMTAILFAVEIGQLFIGSRSCDIDDVILNLFGAVLFYGLWKIRSVQEFLKNIYALK